MFPIARLGDPVTHDKLIPSGIVGPPLPGTVPVVMVEFLPAACMGDFVTCTGLTSAGPAHPPQLGPPPAVPPSMPIATGSARVLIGGRPTGRWSIDVAGCGVFLGDEKLLPIRKVFIG